MNEVWVPPGLQPERRLVRGAQVADGTSASLYFADLLIEDSRIVALCPPGSVDDRTVAVIEATGMVVAPGFVDVHSHGDNAPFLDADDTTKILQGVTTEVVGNCGFSLAPVDPDRRDLLASFNGRIFPHVEHRWTSWDSFMSAADARGYVTNYAPLVGHHSLRIAAMGMSDARVSGPDMGKMCALLDEAMAGGAFGFSSGLIYPPGMFSTIEELVDLAGRLPSGRVYATHMRDEGHALLNSLDEALAIGRRASCRVQVSHLKVTGRENWGLVDEALSTLARARACGLAVGQDVYPYEASSTMLSSCLPAAFQSADEATVLSKLTSPAQLATLREAIETAEGPQSGSDWGSRVVVASTASHGDEGMSLDEIAAHAGGDAIDALVKVLVRERLRATMIHFSMSEADVETVLSDPATMIGSDGLPPGSGGRPHPRLFGTFPRVLGRFVRERRLLSLPEAIAKMTSLPADTYGLSCRGRIEVGAVADLVAFDPDTVADVGSYRDPVHPPQGIEWVMQAGQVVVAGGRWLGHRRGQRLTPT